VKKPVSLGIRVAYTFECYSTSLPDFPSCFAEQGEKSLGTRAKSLSDKSSINLLNKQEMNA
jgi:hypothetical protein